MGPFALSGCTRTTVNVERTAPPPSRVEQTSPREASEPAHPPSPAAEEAEKAEWESSIPERSSAKKLRAVPPHKKRRRGALGALKARSKPRGVLRASGSLSRTKIRRAVKAQSKTVRRCYRAALSKNPALKGKVISVQVKMVISPKGRVASVSLTSASKQKGMLACIKKSVSRWRFPKPKGGIAIVRYPFVFRSPKNP
jgi:outer membrane biosynthesis protein TonB